MNKDMENEKELDEVNASIPSDGGDIGSGGSDKPKRETKDSKTPVLDSFGRDLSKMVEEGKIDPIIGRDKEIERVSQILSRRKKNNPILIGEPGCVDGDTLITVRKTSDDIGHEIINK